MLFFALARIDRPLHPKSQLRQNRTRFLQSTRQAFLQAVTRRYETRDVKGFIADNLLQQSFLLQHLPKEVLHFL